MQIQSPKISDFRDVQHQHGHQVFCSETNERYLFVNLITDGEKLHILLKTPGTNPTHITRTEAELENFVLEKKNNSNGSKLSEFIKLIKTNHTHLFKKPYAPFAIEIKEQLQEAYPDADETTIKKAVTNIAKYPIYLETIINSVGKPRINLDGTKSVTTVSIKDKFSATGRLIGSLNSRKQHYLEKLGEEKFTELAKLAVMPVNQEDTRSNAPLDQYHVIDKVDALRILNAHELHHLSKITKKITSTKNQRSDFDAEKYICISDLHPQYDNVATLTGHELKKKPHKSEV
ncbi:hypothetical protein [Pseudoalteromonas marina]|uniref:Uncharacterized protein n=1 Tax=Pseudoalteromonas marina TaxID=267375 RepID=A0ABT9FCF2_9GAMM|nr:hypothetical protein [Pseudoalteromonas marina]MDP2564459.1 hypothetical protein [Pseudoalteromonas marina]